MRKSVKREKELDRTYDYAEAYGFANAAANVGFVKRRARRKLRHDEKAKIKNNDNICQWCFEEPALEGKSVCQACIDAANKKEDDDFDLDKWLEGD